ncbi:tRNA pseudouridine(38-40) synthase TruA [Aestuariibacter halophilus]|uniref:tRNA pseudouridine synthase A n=1 Tax=Fluctibacter halophilus TaxID=226011 RepID=A0ABS8G859_9ALTE|nr:tRNA pseudouridine(38-40) synthase TruA [Aestuariibacter halophilus]MCC2616772.1 tRNA pseudouridine(38-40) synthase TruA [Aestuariibacter halophilus]
MSDTLPKPEAFHRIALGIEYDGASYYGWQRQREVVGVQQVLEQALSQIAATPVELQCAGRTDAGVHATGQVIHVDVPASRPMRAWTLGMNANLPDSIAVKWAMPVSEDFHARFSATARRYRYIIYNNRLRGGILTRGVTHFHQELDEQRMHQAAQCLVGEHDFSAFRAAICQSKTPYRNVTRVSVKRQGPYVILDIQANAFLHHMVRNITGSLLSIGCGDQPVEWMAEVLASRDRTIAAATAKPNGLYLVDVTYPQGFGLPRLPLGPLFLADE